jgi:hypothetical protein
MRGLRDPSGQSLNRRGRMEWKGMQEGRTARGRAGIYGRRGKAAGLSPKAPSLIGRPLNPGGQTVGVYFPGSHVKRSGHLDVVTNTGLDSKMCIILIVALDPQSYDLLSAQSHHG